MVFITIAEVVSFLGLGVMTIGMFVANLMFRRMNWEVEPPKSMGGWLSHMWITTAKSNAVLRRHALMYPESKARIVYKTASVSAIAGCVVTLLRITISVLYTLRGF
jgi:hypothetical protein